MHRVTQVINVLVLVGVQGCLTKDVLGVQVSEMVEKFRDDVEQILGLVARVDETRSWAEWQLKAPG